MKKYYLIIIALLTIASPSFCQLRGFGLGFVVGEPTGISGKAWLSANNAIDFGVGWTRQASNWGRMNYQESTFHLHVDYLWHDFSLIRSSEKFGIFYGGGCTIDNGVDGGDFGARGSVGIEWIPRNVPMDVFVEIAPIFFLAPSTDFGMNAGLGARFFFK